MPGEIEPILEKEFSVSRETAETLGLYVEHLHRWQQKINLIGPSTVHETWQRHIFDSLHLLQFISDRETPLIDIGSGAGLPGLILAIAGMKHVTLVESDSKKCAFLREAARLCKISVSIENCRVEKLQPKPYGVITSRALAPLGRLFEWCECFTNDETICLFPKGKNYSKEIDDAKQDWSFECIKHPPGSGSDGFVLEISQIRRLKPL